jgi:hypothetical protein
MATLESARVGGDFFHFLVFFSRRVLHLSLRIQKKNYLRSYFLTSPKGSAIIVTQSKDPQILNSMSNEGNKTYTQLFFSSFHHGSLIWRRKNCGSNSELLRGRKRQQNPFPWYQILWK